MDLYGEHSKSIPQKLFLHLAEAIWLWGSFWILFKQGGSWVEEHLNIHNAAESQGRRILVYAFNSIVFLRMAYGMIFLVKRRMHWEEAFSIAVAFGLYYVGFSLFVLPESVPLGWLDYLAIGLFIAGSALNTAGEILRDRWKKQPANQGRLYTGGLFRYSRHINYFGDLVWVIAYALVTRNIFAASIPLFLFCFFAFYNAPALDKHLKNKYGAAFDEYAARTKMLIPYIF